MENVFFTLAVWCRRYPLTIIMVLAVVVGVTVGSMVEEKPVYQGDVWIKCGVEMPVQAKAYHFKNQFYYEVDGRRLQVKLSRCTITRPE